MEEKKYVLEGVFTEFGNTSSYPGRIYGLHVWDKKKKRWKVDPLFEKELGIQK
jgi:hypothetical protein